MSQLEFRLLGPLEAVEDDRPLALGGAKQRALLAVLLLHANQVVSSDRLIDEVWGEIAAGDGRKMVQVYVSRLRKQLGEARLLTRAARLPAAGGSGGAGRGPLRAPRRRGAPGGRGRRGREAPGGARAMAGAAARRPRLRARRPGRDRAPGGVALGGARAAHRRRPRRRAGAGAGRRARVARRRAAAARAAARTADAGALPLLAPGAKRWRRTGARGASWPMGSGWSRATSCAGSSRRSCTTTRSSLPPTRRRASTRC